MKWMAAAHSILTFPLLFALSLFNEARVQVRAASRASSSTGCSMVRATLAGAFPVNCTTRSRVPLIAHNRTRRTPWRPLSGTRLSLVMVLYIEFMAPARSQMPSIALAVPKLARHRARLHMQTQHTVAPGEFAFQFWQPAMSTCALPSAHKEKGTAYRCLPYP